MWSNEKDPHICVCVCVCDLQTGKLCSRELL